MEKERSYVEYVDVCDICDEGHHISDSAIHEYASGKHLCRSCLVEALHTIPLSFLDSIKESSAYFRMYGVGNFDLTDMETETIIRKIVRGDVSAVRSLYEQLSEKRLG